MKLPKVTSRDRIFLARGFAVGVVSMSVLSIGLDAYKASHNFQTDEALEQTLTASDKAADILSQAMRLSDQVMNREITEQEIPLIVTGALQALDPYSGYVEKEWTDRLTGESEILSESFMIGVVGEVREEGYVIVSTMPMSPAERAGIRRGDILAGIDGLDVQNLTGADARDALKDAAQEGAGAEMSLRFMRDGSPISISLTPEHLPETFVYDLGLRDGILQLRITSFMEGIAAQAEDIIERYVEKGDLRGIIFDLRGNTGGLTSEARLLAELVMPLDTLLYTEQGLRINTKKVATLKEPVFPGLRLSAVVDDGSASASEIFASALQANELGLVYGEISYGKGTIQNVYPFTDGQGGIKITVGEYHDAKGRAINGIGVIPDVVVTRDGEETSREDLTILQATQDMLQEPAKSALKKEDPDG